MRTLIEDYPLKQLEQRLDISLAAEATARIVSSDIAFGLIESRENFPRGHSAVIGGHPSECGFSLFIFFSKRAAFLKELLETFIFKRRNTKTESKTEI